MKDSLWGFSLHLDDDDDDDGDGDDDEYTGGFFHNEGTNTTNNPPSHSLYPLWLPVMGASTVQGVGLTKTVLKGISGGGQGDGSLGEQGVGGVPEMGEERAGGGREIQKGKLLLFVTAYFQSKKRTQERFLTSI